MKKLFALLAITSLMVACGNSAETTPATTDTTAAPAATDTTTAPVAADTTAAPAATDTTAAAK